MHNQVFNKRENKKILKYAEFCAGIGGFRLGINQSGLGWECVYSNEIDSKCENTYKLNFGSNFNSKDIFNINLLDLPDFDMLCAGFPCQPFSVAGKNLGFEDPRGKIFDKLINIIEFKQPSVVFLENVPNIVSHNNGQTFRYIKESLINLGYNFNYAILNSELFGIPQKRPRVYIVAFLASTYSNKDFSFTKQNKSPKNLRSILQIGDNSIPISDKWNKYIDLYLNKIKIEDIDFDVPKTRTKLERVATDCKLEDCILQIRSSGIRAYSLDGQFPTFAVSNSGGGAMIPVLTKERRHINIVEMKRLMGFPDSFKFNVSRTDSIKQLANAVCPPVIESICLDINEFIHSNEILFPHSIGNVLVSC